MIEAAAKNLPAKYTDDAGKAYLARTKLKNLKGRSGHPQGALFVLS